MSTPRIAIIVSTTREGRFADKPAQWIFNLARAHGAANFEVVDLRDYPMPLFNESASPAAGVVPKNPAAQRWGDKVAGFDGYIFVTAEYNRSVPGVLKNAIDYLYPQLNRKPVAFVAYGSVGGARAVEHLRLILIEMQAAPLRNAVHIGLAEFLGMLQQGKTFADYPYLEQSAKVLLDDLQWWTSTLKAGREASSIDARLIA
jgi:NAD(P)H-dependent FMN reductase